MFLQLLNKEIFLFAGFQREKNLIFAKRIFVLSLYFSEVAHEVARLMIGHIMSKSDGQICNSLEKGILLSDNANTFEISISLNSIKTLCTSQIRIIKAKKYVEQHHSSIFW